MHDGQEAGQQADRDRDPRGVAEHTAVDRDRQHVGQKLRGKVVDRANRAVCDPDADQCARKRQQKTFDQELSRDGAAARSKRGPDRELALLAVGPGEEQVGTFTQPIRRTNTTPPCRRYSEDLMGWTRSAWTRPMDILWPVLSRKPLNIGVAVS